MLVAFFNRDLRAYTRRHEKLCVYDTDDFTCEEVGAEKISKAIKEGVKFENLSKPKERGSIVLGRPPVFSASDDNIFIQVTKRKNTKGMPYREGLYVINRDYYSVVPLFLGVSWILGGDGEKHPVGMLTPPEYIDGGIYCRHYTIKVGKLIFVEFVDCTDKRFFRYEKNFLSHHRRRTLL